MPATAPDVQALGQHLRQRRTELNWSRERLATASGLTVKTVRNLESCSQQEVRSGTLVKLAAVAELNFDPARFGFTHETFPVGGANCWLAPGFNPIDHMADLVRRLAGRGGRLAQHLMYLDLKSAADWLAQTDYSTAAQSGFPAAQCAAAVVDNLRGVGVDVIALGSGGGRTETLLVQHILAALDRRSEDDMHDMAVFLLDISQPLLAVAHLHAQEGLVAFRGVNVYAVQGDFHQLPSYGFLFNGRQHRRRLFCMLGGTFGNLDHEVDFVRDSLAGCRAGDLLMIDIAHVFAPRERPDEIRARDPRLNGSLPEAWRAADETWLCGPLQRYMDGANDITLRPVLDLECCQVPGSYAVELRATVRPRSGSTAEREFGAFRVKRHDQRQLCQTMQRLGWRPLVGYSYAAQGGPTPPRSVHIFQRASDENQR